MSFTRETQNIDVPPCEVAVFKNQCISRFLVKIIVAKLLKLQDEKSTKRTQIDIRNIHFIVASWSLMFSYNIHLNTKTN